MCVCRFGRSARDARDGAQYVTVSEELGSWDWLVSSGPSARVLRATYYDRAGYGYGPPGQSAVSPARLMIHSVKSADETAPIFVRPHDKTEALKELRGCGWELRS